MAAPLTRRASLSINPLMLVLVLLLIGVLAWRCWMMLDLLQQTGAYTSGKRIGVIVGSVFVAALSLAVAGAVGAGAYFASDRNYGVANAGIAVVLLLTLGWFGYDTYRGATRERPIPKATASSLSQRVQDNLEAQRRASEQAMQRARDAASRPPHSVTPVSPLPLQPEQPATGVRPVPPAPAEAPTTRPAPRAPTANDLEAERKAKAALAPLRDEVSAKIASFLTAATPVSESLNKPPKALRSELEARVKGCTEVKQHAAELEAFLRSIDERAERALTGAGLDFGDQVRQRMEFSRSIDTFAKANACDIYQRLFDAGLEEGQALRDNVGKWRYDGSGQITSADRSLQSRLRHLREGVSQRQRGIPEAQATLRSGVSTGTP